MSADTAKGMILDDTKAALVCDDSNDRREIAEGALDDLNFKVQTAESPEDVYEKVKYNHYDVIYLHETFGGGSSENNEVLEFIQTMPITARRKTFVILVGTKHSTFDHMAAYSESVNVVLNEKDMREIKTILKKAVTGNFMFYKVYNEILRDAGKA